MPGCAYAQLWGGVRTAPPRHTPHPCVRLTADETWTGHKTQSITLDEVPTHFRLACPCVVKGVVGALTAAQVCQLHNAVHAGKGEGGAAEVASTRVQQWLNVITHPPFTGFGRLAPTSMPQHAAVWPLLPCSCVCMCMCGRIPLSFSQRPACVLLVVDYAWVCVDDLLLLCVPSAPQHDGRRGEGDRHKGV